MKTLERNKRFKSKNPFKKTWNGVPATKRVSCDGSLFESFFLSIVCHIVGALLIWLLAFLLLFFGITPKLFPTSKPKIKDIEFNITGQPIHRHRHSRRAAQSSAGASTMTPKISETAQAPSPAPSVNPKPKSIALPKIFNRTNKNENTSMNNKSVSKALTGQAKRAKSSNSGSHSKSADASDFSSSMSSLKSMSSGLGGTGTGKGRHHASGVGASGSSFGSFDGPSAGNSSSGRSGFDKNATKKIISTYDISPYVSELKRNIRWNWKAPKTNGNKRVELFLRIAKDGRVIILNVKRTSEVGEVDNAALNAVKRCYPLNPLPSKYKKNFLDVVFTFDSNSIGSRF